MTNSNHSGDLSIGCLLPFSDINNELVNKDLHKELNTHFETSYGVDKKGVHVYFKVNSQQPWPFKPWCKQSHDKHKYMEAYFTSLWSCELEGKVYILPNKVIIDAVLSSNLAYSSDYSVWNMYSRKWMNHQVKGTVTFRLIRTTVIIKDQHWKSAWNNNIWCRQAKWLWRTNE